MNNILKTDNNNYYLFHSQKNKVAFIHPLIYFFFEKEAEAVNTNDWINNLKGSRIHLEGIGVFTKKEIQYYYRKYNFFKENKYFNDDKEGPSFQRRLNKNEIENLITGCKEVIFEVTKACNLDCRYCIQGEFYELHDKEQKLNIDLKKAKLLLKYLEPYWSRSMASDRIGIKFYGGEPLVNMDAIKEIVDYSKTLIGIKSKFYYYITTNGVLLDRYLDYLIANNFYISISLDGGKENNSYRVFRDGTSSFEKITENIKMIRNNSPSYFKDNVSFQSILHNRNSITDLDDYFENTFQKQPTMSELTRVGVKKGQKKNFDKIYASTYKNLYYGKDYPLLTEKKLTELPKIPDSGLGGVIVHDIYNWIIKDSDDAIKGSKNTTPTGTCHPFSKRIFLSTDGRILPCERIDHKYALGYIKDRVRLDFQTVADKFNKFYDNMIDLCGSCSISKFCKKCMFTCNVDKTNPVCNHYLGQKDFLQKLSENIFYIEDRTYVYFKHITEI